MVISPVVKGQNIVCLNSWFYLVLSGVKLIKLPKGFTKYQVFNAPDMF
jgi:hypothetical protein